MCVSVCVCVSLTETKGILVKTRTKTKAGRPESGALSSFLFVLGQARGWAVFPAGTHLVLLPCVLGEPASREADRSLVPGRTPYPPVPILGTGSVVSAQGWAGLGGQIWVGRFGEGSGEAEGTSLQRRGGGGELTVPIRKPSGMAPKLKCLKLKPEIKHKVNS